MHNPQHTPDVMVMFPLRYLKSRHKYVHFYRLLMGAQDVTGVELYKSEIEVESWPQLLTTAVTYVYV